MQDHQPMCDQCRSTPLIPTLSRRTLLSLGATLAGAALGLWSCREEPEAPRTSTGPLTPRAAVQTPSTVAATQTATGNPGEPAALAGPAADLGSEVFPDASGRAIASPADAPVIIIPRNDWTSRPPNLAQIEVMNGIDKITVHHTAGEMLTDAWNPTAGELEHIRSFHAGTRPSDRNCADIAYHFVIDRAGRVWQARPLVYQGAHVRGHNEHNLGIVLLGNFETQSPTAAQLWSLAEFITFARHLYRIPLSQVFTHGELGQTSCPGKTLQSYMDRTRRAWAAAEMPPDSRPAT